MKLSDSFNNIDRLSLLENKILGLAYDNNFMSQALQLSLN